MSLILWLKLQAAAWTAFIYNHLLTHVPSRRLRLSILRLMLADCSSEASVQMNCCFLHAARIHVGPRTVLNFGTLLDGRRYPIQIGSDVSIGPEASILTLGHDPRSPHFSDHGGPVQIGDRAWIGYRAIVLPGISIGEGAVVGAGSIVTHDVQPYKIVAGNPARVIGERPQDLSYRLSYYPFLV